MIFEVEPRQPVGGSSPARRVEAVTPRLPPAPADAVIVSLPASPPAEVREAIAAGAARAAELRAQNRALHFRKDQLSGRVIVEVRDLSGNVIRTILPSTALNIMAGAAT
jgi:flagellar protein FlaG